MQSNRGDQVELLQRLADLVAADDDRAAGAKEAVECIRAARDFHWVGLYDVLPEEIRAIAWTGEAAPAFPVFPRTAGLNGAAVSAGRPVICNDVQNDPRYLTTFGATRAEAVIPVWRGAEIVGTIDVESDRVNAFSEDDERFLIACAKLVEPFWSKSVIPGA